MMVHQHEVTCLKCGWVHIVMPAGLDPDEAYRCCYSCAYTGFRNARVEDAPIGVTLQPVVLKDGEVDVR